MMSASKSKENMTKTAVQIVTRSRVDMQQLKKPTQIIKNILQLLISGVIPQILIMQRTALFPHQKTGN